MTIKLLMLEYLVGGMQKTKLLLKILRRIYRIEKYFSISLKEKFNTVDYNANQLWKNINIHNTDELINKIIYVLNEKYPKLNISECQFKEKLKYMESQVHISE